MTRIVGITSVCLSLTLLASCATRLPPDAAHPPEAPTISVAAQKYFTVVVKRKLFGGCKVEVSPEKDPQKVRVTMGMTVAWVASNECSTETGVELLEFVRGNMKLTAEELFEDIVKTDYTFFGKVRQEERLKGRWKYTAGVGTHRKDPDIIIF